MPLFRLVKAGALVLALAGYSGEASARFIQADPIGLEGGTNVYAYVDGNPLSYIDPAGLFLTFTLNELTRGEYRIPSEDAIRISNFSSAIGVTGAAIAVAGPIVVVAGVEGGAAICRAIPETLPKVAEACKNPLLAFTLGAAICGNVSGTVKNSARNFTRDRETIEEIRNATSRTLRRNTGVVPRP